MTLDTSSLTMCTTRYRDPVMLLHTPMILNNVLKRSHRNHVFGRAKPCLLSERQTYSTQSSTTLTEERVYSVNKNDLDELTYYAAYCVSAGSQMLPCDCDKFKQKCQKQWKAAVPSKVSVTSQCHYSPQLRNRFRWSFHWIWCHFWNCADCVG